MYNIGKFAYCDYSCKVGLLQMGYLHNNSDYVNKN